jgi:predicted O-methyltransferase YrrM
MDFSDVEATYDAKVRGRAVKKKSTTVAYLLKNSFDYDFVYVDADHTAASALIDGEIAWHYLKSGGILAFDDYTWGPDYPPHLAPKLGVNLFIHRYQGKFENLVVNGQVWLRKL